MHMPSQLYAFNLYVYLAVCSEGPCGSSFMFLFIKCIIFLQKAFYKFIACSFSANIDSLGLYCF